MDCDLSFVLAKKYIKVLGGDRMNHRLGGLIALCGLTAIAVSARGSENLDSGAATGTGEVQGVALEEIVVTAQRRPEAFVKVPVAETVLPKQEIEQYQINDLFALQAQVPGLLIGSNSHAFGPSLFIRGIGTAAPNPTTDESIALNIDGLSLTTNFAYLSGLFDVSQVEVLKGPQALFYGQNATGGVISLHTNDPTDKAEIILRSGYEIESQDKFVETIFSGPVSDTLKLRLAAHYDYSNGFFKNLDNPPLSYPNAAPPPATFPTGVLGPPTNNVDKGDNWMIRGTALWEPSSIYNARLKLNYDDESLNYALNEETATCPGGVVSFTGLPFFDPNMKCGLSRNYWISYMDPKYFVGAPNGGIPFFQYDQEYATLEQNVNLSNFTATSITGVYDYDKQSYGNGAQLSGMTPIAIGLHYSDQQVTEEARLTSDFANSPVNFMVGAFYLRGREKNSPDLEGNTALGLPSTLFNVLHTIDIDQVSAFGQVMWKITKELEVDAGDRWTHETRDHFQNDLTQPGEPGLALLDPHLDTFKNNPQVTLIYYPADDMTLYAAYKTGFKSGSFNTAVAYGPTSPTSFGDEDVKGEEIGFKASLFEHTLALNIDAYNYNFKGLQVGANTVEDGVIAIETLNAASANTRGIDLDATYAPPPVQGLTLRGAVNYNDAHYNTFPNSPCANNQTISEGCNQIFDTATGAYTAQDLSGRPLAHAPKWVTTTGFDYTTPIDNGNMALRFGGVLTHVTGYYQNSLDLAAFSQGAYTKGDLNIALEGHDRAWELALIVNNVTDKITAVNCTNSNENGGVILGGQQAGKATGGPAGDDYSSCDPDIGREIWLRVTVRPLALFGR